MGRIILGAGGHAIEVLDVLLEEKCITSEISFFDNVTHSSELFMSLYNVEHDEQNLNNYVSCYIGVGAVDGRRKLSRLAREKKLKIIGLRSKFAKIGQLNSIIDDSVDIMMDVTISSNVVIKEGGLINRRVSIHHDVRIGKFCSIGPSVTLLGKAIVGDEVFIGASATILPNIQIGNNSIIGAGCVVTTDIPENSVVVGVPGRVVGYNRMKE